MCDRQEPSNSTESGRGRSNSQLFNIIDYMESKKSGVLPTADSKEHSINNANDEYSEREICSTALDNIQEEQVAMEYLAPETINQNFSEMIDTSLKMKESAINKSDMKSSDLLASLGYCSSFHQSTALDSKGKFVEPSISRNSIKLTRSKSLTHLDSYLNSLKDYTTMSEKHGEVRESVTKYSHDFLNNERTLQEVSQQNMLAQHLLQKYFKEDELHANLRKRDQPPHPVDGKNSAGKRPSETVSSLIKRYFHHTDRNEQASIKPSDGYVSINAKGASKRNLTSRNPSVKVVRPYKYHKKHWDSGSNFGIVSKTESPLQFDCRKRSRVEFESNMALKQDSSTDLSLKTENVQYVSAEGKRTKRSEAVSDKVLYKTDSKNFENARSLEELHAFMPERYMSLRNLYGYNYMENITEQVGKPRYALQTLPKMRGESSRELVLKFFDSGSHIKVTDDDYKKWLKEKDFIKYTDFTNTSVSSVTFRSISQKIVNYAITPATKTKEKEKKRHRSSILHKSHQVGYVTRLPDTRTTMPCLTASLENCNFANIEYNNLYQLIIYEHIVISNVINFYCSFNATRIRKLTVVDRVYQFTFLLFSYYILSFINNRVFGQYGHAEKWF